MAKQAPPKRPSGGSSPSCPAIYSLKHSYHTHIMSTKTTSNTSDKLKWLSVVLLLSVGIVSFYTLTEYSLLLRVLSLLAIVAIVAVIAFSTTKGQDTKDFLRETNIEVRKVVWPTRQETIQMTGIVIIMVIILSLFIWAIDSLLWWIVQSLTGQGG